MNSLKVLLYDYSCSKFRLFPCSDNTVKGELKLTNLRYFYLMKRLFDLLEHHWASLSDQPDLLNALLPLVRQVHRQAAFSPSDLPSVHPFILDFLLKKGLPTLYQTWQAVPENLVHYAFRHACGWTPCPKADRLAQWQKQHLRAFGCVLPPSLVVKKGMPIHFDPKKSRLLPGEHYDDLGIFTQLIERQLKAANAAYAFGGYGEPRPFYLAPQYQQPGNNGPRWRSVHLGIDLWAPAGTPVLAPMDGTIHGLADNQGAGNYGPTAILRHQLADGLEVFTLYGHLSRRSMANLQKGQAIAKGTAFAEYGQPDENGYWPPHLHYQWILDMLGFEDDFPGVAFPEEAVVWKGVCPRPVCSVFGK